MIRVLETERASHRYITHSAADNLDSSADAAELLPSPPCLLLLAGCWLSDAGGGGGGAGAGAGKTGRIAGGMTMERRR